MREELSNTTNIAFSENENILLTYSTNRTRKINPKNHFAKHCTGQFILLLDRRKLWTWFAYESSSSCVEMVIKMLSAPFHLKKAVSATVIYLNTILHCFQQEIPWSKETNISFINALKNVLYKLLWCFILHVSFGITFHRIL